MIYRHPALGFVLLVAGSEAQVRGAISVAAQPDVRVFAAATLALIAATRAWRRIGRAAGIAFRAACGGDTTWLTVTAWAVGPLSGARSLERRPAT